MKREQVIEKMLNSPENVSFSELSRVCTHYFGAPRNKGTSHFIYKTPWPGDPRINIQHAKGGKAKVYQVKQVLKALTKLEDINGN